MGGNLVIVQDLIRPKTNTQKPDSPKFTDVILTSCYYLFAKNKNKNASKRIDSDCQTKQNKMNQNQCFYLSCPKQTKNIKYCQIVK